ncbi:hypothetical protein L3X38_033304 [Prunus dulcis]|uniref:Uncharacterized protein n=1 Tax=Prunus dulcis TaxID=3755 RepID=A0AAD4YWP6_PRUDU|nr:hypothetical protein L3X38_033304 [Prunus dulcis]
MLTPSLANVSSNFALFNISNTLMEGLDNSSTFHALRRSPPVTPEKFFEKSFRNESAGLHSGIEINGSSPNTRAKGSSSSRSLAYLTGDGVDNHAIEVQSKIHRFVQKNLDENVLHLFENTLVLGPHWFGHVPAEMAELFKDDAEAPLCFQSSSALASHKNLSRSFPSSEVRNSSVKWADWIDMLLPRYGAHWKQAEIYDAILLSKQSMNRDENLLAATLCFWNFASNTFYFCLGPMGPYPTRYGLDF